jgi:hypothetical protein
MAKTQTCVERFARLRTFRDAVEKFTTENVPYDLPTEPVLVERNMFDMLCIAAMAGLEAAENWEEAQERMRDAYKSVFCPVCKGHHPKNALYCAGAY